MLRVGAAITIGLENSRRTRKSGGLSAALGGNRERLALSNIATDGPGESI